MKYVFALLEHKFDEKIHDLTGLVDINEHPIVRLIEVEVKTIGFHGTPCETISPPPKSSPDSTTKPSGNF